MEQLLSLLSGIALLGGGVFLKYRIPRMQFNKKDRDMVYFIHGKAVSGHSVELILGVVAGLFIVIGMINIITFLISF